jgi:periplasmic divalent cation tolerance protein
VYNSTNDSSKFPFLVKLTARRTFSENGEIVEKETLLTPAWEIQTTVGQATDAETLARAILQQRLAACVQIDGPIRSLYHWQGQIQDDAEWRLTIKTSQRNYRRCMKSLRRNHPYQVPELLARPWANGDLDYLRWLEEQAIGPAPFHIRLSNERQLLKVNFEEVCATLSACPNLHFEPDGSFVWRSASQTADGDLAWQLDGMVYDRHGSVSFLELKGTCDFEAWTTLIQACAAEAVDSLRVQDVPTGRWQTATEFSKGIA